MVINWAPHHNDIFEIARVVEGNIYPRWSNFSFARMGICSNIFLKYIHLPQWPPLSSGFVPKVDISDIVQKSFYSTRKTQFLGNSKSQGVKA